MSGRRRTISRAGFTLIELLAAMAITTILLGGTLSAVMIAGKAVPSANDAATSTIAGAQVTEQIAGELETATLVLEQTPTALTLVVPAHQGDTLPERVRYSWSGVAGAPLLRQYNRGAAVAVVDSVYGFAITPTIATSTESYPGATTEDALESLVINNIAATGLGSLNVAANASYGQYFAPPAFASDVVAWRPTRVAFMAQQGSLAGVTNVQIVTPDGNLLPNGAVIEQYTLAGSSLGATLATQQFPLSNVGRLATTSGICLALTCSVGLPTSVILQNNPNSGLLQATTGTWSYVGNKQLQSQLYAKLTHAGATLAMTSKYMGAAGFSVRSGNASNLAVQGTGQTLNHPEMLSAFWEAKFDKDPTALDVNADGTPDWSVHGGGTLNLLGLVNLTLQVSGTGLDSQPGDDFSRMTVIDLRCRGLTSGSWAGVNFNAARSGAVCAPIGAMVTLNADGTQTATVWRKTNDLTQDTLVTVSNLPGRPVDLHLIVDPTSGTVGISVNAARYGTFLYNSFSSTDGSRSVSLTSSGSAEFDYVRIREVMP